MLLPRSLRPALALGVAAALTFAGTSHAADAPCNLVTDDKGDAGAGLLQPPGANQPAWDIVSADVASDAKTLTTVVRVDKLAKTVTDDPTGSMWRFNFSVGDAQLFTEASSSLSSGDQFTIGYVDTTSHALTTTATGVWDLAKNEVRMSVPVADFAEQAKITPGSKITGMGAWAGDYLDVAGQLSGSFAADEAEGSKTYTAGNASCVAVGK